MNTWGENFKLSIFGESHGEGIGVVIDGIPSGFSVDMEKVNEQMKRRAPGRSTTATARKEADQVNILSGFLDGKTTGTPLCGVIYNTNTISKDYNGDLLRPSHADYTAICKYGESRDFRGGGHFSGRITAPLVFAGAIARQILEEKGIFIGSHIGNIGKVYDKDFDPVNIDKELLKDLSSKDFPVIDETIEEKMREEVETYKRDLNSVGGSVEVAVSGIGAGFGSPFFGSVESRLSSMMFSIPAVKGIEFGMGFDFSESNGKDANDEFYIENGVIKTKTNNNAGINGGITNGMPITFRIALKPTPSIASKQNTVDISKMENTEIEIHGRHDPCIVPRAAVVAEAATAVTILDIILTEQR